jgi:hypothetical protein
VMLSRPMRIFALAQRSHRVRSVNTADFLRSARPDGISSSQ